MDPRELPQVKAWLAGRSNFDPRPFVQANATIAEAVSLALLLWPTFIEYRGGIFLSFAFDGPGVDVWLERLEGDIPSVEGAVNHIHLWDVLIPQSDEEYQALSGLANVMASSWAAALTSAYPDQEFVVSVADEPEEYGPTLSFRSRPL